jgi:hypothetical protein
LAVCAVAAAELAANKRESAVRAVAREDGAASRRDYEITVRAPVEEDGIDKVVDDNFALAKLIRPELVAGKLAR